MPEPGFDFLPVRELDRGSLRDFGAAVWGEPARDEILDRWWVRSDFAKAQAAVAADGRIAGLCVGVPSEWALPDRPAGRAVSICGWFVAPSFGGRGLGKTLVQSFGDEAPFLNALSISPAAIRNFSKLGWVGPFQTWLRLLPLPLLRRIRSTAADGFGLSSFTASADSMPEPLAAALDAIDAAKPADQLRRKRRAMDWRAHLSARPKRHPRFHLVSRDGTPIAYFIIRSTDEEAGPLYRRARLHYVSDLVVNAQDEALLRFTYSAMAQAAPASAGALLLCTSSELLAEAASASGWLSERSPVIGPRLADKAPLYMLGGDFVPLAGQDFHLTFADSDVDLNI